jgi:HK97 family phage major capsid protein
MATRAPQPPGKFSILELINGASYEQGLSEIAASKYGAPQLRGMALPSSALVRDLGLQTASAGGNLAGTELAAVAAAVRPLLVLDQLGAGRIEVSGAAQLDLPKFSGGAGSWIAEGEAAASLATTVLSTSAVARCAAARLGLSRRVLNANRSDVEGSVLAEIQRAVRDTVERGFIQGSGSDAEPLGIANVPGTGSKTFNAATPSWAELLDMLELLGDADANITEASWLMHPSMLADLMAVQIDADGGELVVIWADGQHRIAGLPLAVSTNCPESKILLADWRNVQTVYFGAPQLVPDKFSGGKVTTGAMELVLLTYCDVVLREPSHVVVGSA